ncbi:MAG TPA: HTH domain-containing protein [Candidatus Nanoarchaeia archaeon]|nr:HTH domain-containing protein [Candidatus Nanoarchaeia archaeon]
MVDFACKKFIFDDILKCSLGLTKKEFNVLKYLIDNSDMELTTLKIKDKLNLNLTTIQKAVKKLSEKKILLKCKKNLDYGGYIYVYEVNYKSQIKIIIKEIIKNWNKKVEEEIDKWE